MKRKRTVVHIVFDAKSHQWLATIAGMVTMSNRARYEVIDWWRGVMVSLTSYGHEGQIVVHSKNGRIAFEHTYLNDPKQSRG